MFARSRAVGNYQLILREFVEVIHDLGLGNQFGSPNVAGVIRSFIAHVDYKSLILIQQTLQLGNGNPARAV